MSSSSLLDSCSCSSTPTVAVSCSALGSAVQFLINVRHPPSTVRNISPSFGICAMMSGELKMGSRYSHVACTFSHSSIVSCERISRFSQS